MQGFIYKAYGYNPPSADYLMLSANTNDTVSFGTNGFFGIFAFQSVYNSRQTITTLYVGALSHVLLKGNCHMQIQAITPSPNCPIHIRQALAPGRTLSLDDSLPSSA